MVHSIAYFFQVHKTLWGQLQGLVQTYETRFAPCKEASASSSPCRPAGDGVDVVNVLAPLCAPSPIPTCACQRSLPLTQRRRLHLGCGVGGRLLWSVLCLGELPSPPIPNCRLHRRRSGRAVDDRAAALRVVTCATSVTCCWCGVSASQSEAASAAVPDSRQSPPHVPPPLRRRRCDSAAARHAVACHARAACVDPESLRLIGF